MIERSIRKQFTFCEFVIMYHLLYISHIEGKVNPSDIFTKEDKDPQHFISIRNLLLHSIPTYGSSIEHFNHLSSP